MCIVFSVETWNILLKENSLKHIHTHNKSKEKKRKIITLPKTEKKTICVI